MHALCFFSRRSSIIQTRRRDSGRKEPSKRQRWANESKTMVSLVCRCYFRTPPLYFFVCPFFACLWLSLCYGSFSERLWRSLVYPLCAHFDGATPVSCRWPGFSRPLATRATGLGWNKKQNCLPLASHLPGNCLDITHNLTQGRHLPGRESLESQGSEQTL